MSQVRFTDPRTGVFYDWATNPGWDQVTTPAGKQRSVTRTSNTSNLGVTRQQGDDGPVILHWEPFVYTEAQEVQLWFWYDLSTRQTIYLSDWNGEESEGQVVTCQRKWLGALSGPGDTRARVGYAQYTFEWEVYRWLSGVQYNAGLRVA